MQTRGSAVLTIAMDQHPEIFHKADQHDHGGTRQSQEENGFERTHTESENAIHGRSLRRARVRASKSFRKDFVKPATLLARVAGW